MDPDRSGTRGQSVLKETSSLQHTGILDPATQRALELDALLQAAAGLAQTPGGKQKVASHQASSDLQEITQLLRETTEARRWVEELRPSMAGLEDAAQIVAALEVAELALEPGAVLVAAAWVQTAWGLRAALKPVGPCFPLLWSRLGSLPDLTTWATEVERTLGPDGVLLDSASPEIRRIRAAVTATRHRLNRSLERYFSQPDVLQDSYVTERGGRYVIPVRAERKDAIKGVLHGGSSSGATLFLEPLDVVDLNNDLAVLLEQESAETHRVLADITGKIRSRRGDFRRIVDTLEALDAAAARGRLSALHRAVEPVMEEGAGAQGPRLIQVRHPMLIQFLGWSGVVPIDLEFGPGTDVLVVSGPNAGGKTATLKTLGLAAAMAQCGFHVPAAEARLPVLQKIRADVGDHQSLQNSLSTFSSHILRMREILKEAEPGMLVLLDELGTATDPAQGAALGVAMLEVLRQRGARTVATTHLERLKAFAAEHEFAANVALEFDEKLLRPTYRLLRGSAGSSNALNIAERLGLESGVVKTARERMQSHDLAMDNYVRALRRQAEQMEATRRGLEAQSAALAVERIRSEREQQEASETEQRVLQARLAELEREFAGALDRELQSVTERVRRDQWRDAQLQRTRKLRELYSRKAREGHSGNPASRPARKPMLNDYVLITSLEREGIFRGSEGRQAVVEVDGKRILVPLEELQPTESPVAPARRSLPANICFVPAGGGRVVPKELNLIGQTVDEALPRVDKFLDEAFLDAHGSVRLIHGRGTGRLARALREFLRTHPHVESARPAGANDGGDAVTIVQLRA